MYENEKEGAATTATAAYNITQMEVAQESNENLQGAAAAAVPTKQLVAKEALLSCLKEAKERSQEIDPWIDYKRSKRRSYDVPIDTFAQVQEILESCLKKMVEQVSKSLRDTNANTTQDV